MINRNRRERKKAPCGCPAADNVEMSTRYSQQYSATCPALQAGRIPQHGTDLQRAPLNQPHVEYYDALRYQTPEVPLSWQSGSTQIEDIPTEEGFSRYNSGGFNVAFPLVLTPQDGVNLNEPHQMERAAIRGRARAISESMARFVEPEQQEDIRVDENGTLVYSSPQSMPMGPCYFQPPTRSYGTMAAQYGNPSSRGQPSSRHSGGRRSSQDQSSSGRGQIDDFAATYDQFGGQEYERASELSVSEEVEDTEIFQYEN